MKEVGSPQWSAVHRLRTWLLRTASSMIKDLRCDVIPVITIDDYRRAKLGDGV